jgi:hypothetical protein
VKPVFSGEREIWAFNSTKARRQQVERMSFFIKKIVARVLVGWAGALAHRGVQAPFMGEAACFAANGNPGKKVCAKVK